MRIIPLAHLLVLIGFLFIPAACMADTPREWLITGDDAIQKEDYTGAVAAYDQALSLDPSSAVAWSSKGYALSMMGFYGQAAEAYQKSLELDPASSLNWRFLGYTLIQQGKFGEALEAFDQALALDSGDTAAWTGKGLAYNGMSKYEDSIAAFQKAIALNPYDTEGYVGMGIALAERGNYTGALEAFDAALAINPNNIFAWNNKGQVLFKSGKYQEAVEAYEEGLKLDPKNVELEQNRQEALGRLKRYFEGDPGGYTFLPYLLVIVIAAGGIAALFLYRRQRHRTATTGTRTFPLIPGEEETNETSLETIAHDVFITYSSRDKPIADAICAALEAKKIRCWIAPRDVLPGQNYPNAIISAIETSSVMVLVFSSSSNTSQHVIRELGKAVGSGLIIIPFRIEDTLPSKDMEYLIGIPHWLDAMTPPIERHLDELTRTVTLVLARRRKEQERGRSQEKKE